MLAPRLAGVADDWWVISGATVVLHGMTNTDITDIDLLCW